MLDPSSSPSAKLARLNILHWSLAVAHESTRTSLIEPGAKIPCSLDKIPCSCKKIPCSVEQGICS
jgi:hypothetical protein